MTAEDKKWLEEAMQQYCNSEIKRIETILKDLQKYNEMSEEILLNLLE